MAELGAPFVFTRDLSSGRIHKRYPTESGELATLEGDNLDQAGAYEVITAIDVADAADGSLCERCFGTTPVNADPGDA